MYTTEEVLSNHICQPGMENYLIDAYSFLEGRLENSSYMDGKLDYLISDDIIERVLNKLLILDGQVLSYRSLDVEQIGSVYEGIMGFTVEKTKGLS